MSRLFTYVVLVPLVAIIIFGAGLHYGMSIKPKPCDHEQLKKDVEELQRHVNILITKQ